MKVIRGAFLYAVGIVETALVGTGITALFTDAIGEAALFWAAAIAVGAALIDGLFMGGWLLGKGKRRRAEQALENEKTSSGVPKPPVSKGTFTGFMVRPGARNITMKNNIAVGGDVGFDISGEGHTLDGNRAIE